MHAQHACAYVVLGAGRGHMSLLQGTRVRTEGALCCGGCCGEQRGEGGIDGCGTQ